ncbi:hypothetical protein COO91_00064 [Nostoc flagelliforme CCNUN1]|uniref:Uncharacterized protein n=1 Tax=Nostoc flagelliforme CCNUN1 TaxID=2038116 RepID=A0A2K8SFL7_9NOSO|nr:hypothetical protein COO91_00064 [Nostoc flagelliforme CCNUN1]
MEVKSCDRVSQGRQCSFWVKAQSGEKRDCAVAQNKNSVFFGVL